MEIVGFVGLGKMGVGMAGNIQKAGYPMVVYDVQEAATRPLLEGGARLASSPAEVSSLSDVSFTSLPMPGDVEQVLTGPEGILEGMKEGGILLDLSTCGPTLVRRLEPMFRAKGAHLLDAPVMSSPTNVLSKEVMVMVGGEREIYDRVKPVLDSFTNTVMYCGPIGTAQVCKLINNTVGFGVGQAIAEGLTLGLKAGVELSVLLEAGQATLGRRVPVLAETVFKGKFEPPSFTLALARKDVGLMTQLARENNVPTPVADVAEVLLMQSMNRGWAEKDYNIYFRMQEEASGVEVRDPKPD